MVQFRGSWRLERPGAGVEGTLALGDSLGGRGQGSGLKPGGGAGLRNGVRRGARGVTVREDGGSEGLTVVGHHGVPLVMLLRRSQMVLYALKLRGQRRQRGQRSHLHSRKRYFLLAGHRYFRFRLRVGPRSPTLPLPRRLSATGARRRQNYAAWLKAVIIWRMKVSYVAYGSSALCW